jgi:hypothetical protein
MTQHLTDPPPAVQALANMLDATSSWALDIWYPSAPANTSGDFAVIAPLEERRTRYAEGALPIPGGSLLLTIYRDDTAGALETEACTTQKELLTLATGLVLRSASVGRCAECGPAKIAGGEVRRAIDLTIEYGLNT